MTVWLSIRLHDIFCQKFFFFLSFFFLFFFFFFFLKVQILLMLEVLSHTSLRLKGCSVVFLSTLNPACSVAISSSACSHACSR